MRLSPAFVLVVTLLIGCGSPSIAQRSRTIDGSGNPGSRTEQAQGVQGVALSVPGTLVIDVGREAPLQIEGDDNIVAAIEIERNGDELTIRAPRNTNFNTNRPLRLRLGVRSLEGASVAGSGGIEASNINADNFDASVAGSGNLLLRGLDAHSVDVSVAGSGDITISGSADNLDVSIAGSGNADVSDLAVGSAAISIAGSGDALVNVSGYLSASIVGSGDVRYTGNPEIERSVMGSGDVEPVRRR